MQQDVVLFADLLHARPVAFGRGDDATAGGHRFQAQQADGVRAFAQDHILNQVGRRDAERFAFQMAKSQFILAVFHTMRHPNEARREGTILQVPLILTTR